jgi:hypothetical protein
MSERHSDASALALRALTREAADLPLPEIDWNHIEQSLMSAVDQPPPLRLAVAPAHVEKRVEAPPRFGSVWAVALAAAAAVALVVTPRSTRSLAMSDANRTGQQTQDADSLPREAAESGIEPLSYHRTGVVSFTLAPHSRVEMAASEPGSMTVILVAGSIHADVTPRSSGEIFAVEVDRTRIAAHGTSFTVSRHGEQAMVEIDHGSVAVGPVGHPGSTQGWLLVGPDRALFSLDGAREARWLGPPSPPPLSLPATKIPTPAPVAVIAPQLPSRASTVEPPPAPRPSVVAATPTATSSAVEEKPAAPEATLPSEHQGDPTAAILRGLEACYERQVSSTGVRFTIVSSLSLTVLPNGTVREGVFNPPLSPTLMSCAFESMSAARFPHGDSLRQVSVPVRLSHAENE